MRGRYIIGVDNGSQSTKVVIYDLEGNAVAEGRQALRAGEPAAAGVVEHPDDDLWGSIVAASREALAGFAGDPREIIGVGLCTIRCCKAFLRADGSLARAGNELDGHPRLSAVHARRSSGGSCHDLVRLHHASLHRAVSRHRRQQHRAAVADRHRYLAMERRLPCCAIQSGCAASSCSNW